MSSARIREAARVDDSILCIIYNIAFQIIMAFFAVKSAYEFALFYGVQFM